MRVKRGLPRPPQYSMADILSSMWIIECSEACIQGTAFDLKGYGTITANHVVNNTYELRAFRANDTARSYPVEIIYRNSDIDLAIIHIKTAQLSVNLEHSHQHLSQMDHIAVCGFPNYRLGDTGIISPGIIVGIRMKSGVRHLLTNAGIVSGMSGGPAVIQNNIVAGICVTGSELMQTGRDTEDQSIIPVEASNLLKR